jgi:Ubiquitin carboxyl-terminal hydrolase
MLFPVILDCVQMIAHTPPLAMMLLSAGLKEVDGNDLNRVVQKIIATLLKPRPLGMEMAFSLEDALPWFPVKYQKHEEECAFEFFMDLLELVDADFATKWDKRPLEIMESSRNLTYKCPCGFLRNSKIEVNTVVALALPRTGDGELLATYSLQEMFNDFAVRSNEVRDSNALCTECGMSLPTNEQITFTMIGTVLVLNIQFFDENGDKILVPVNIEQTLDILLKCPEAQSFRSVEYELTSIVYHHGQSKASGHYTTRFRGPNGWNEANDERMFPVDGPNYRKPGQQTSTSVPFLVVFTRSGQVPGAIHHRLCSMATDFQCFELLASR